MLREEHKLRTFDNRLFRRIFGPNKEEMTGAYRELYSGEIYNFSSLLNIERMVKLCSMRWAGHVACMGKMRNVCNIFIDGRIIVKWLIKK
jgi:hypothetical protein